MDAAVDKEMRRAEQYGLVALRQLVKDALDERDGNVEKTINYVVYTLLHDKKLLQAVVGAAVRELANSLVTDRIRGQRKSITHHAQKSNVVHLACGLEASFLNMPLRGGLRLKEHTHAQLMMASEHYLAAGKNSSHKGRWLEAIAAALPPGARVGDALAEAKVAELWASTEKE